MSPPGATRNWVRFACVICYEKLRFPGFLEILASRRFPRKLMMGNDLDRNCPDLASPARSWRNSITNKGFAVFLPIELMLSKGGSYLLRFATCRLRFLLRFATFPATYQLRVGYKAAGPAPFWHQRMRLAHGRSLDEGPARIVSCQINPGEAGRAANRQAFASPSYSANRQVSRNPRVGRPRFLRSMSLHPRTAVRPVRHAGLLLTPNCQRWSARSRHS